LGPSNINIVYYSYNTTFHNFSVPFDARDKLDGLAFLY
jgi:hypothetical protein